MPRHCGQGLIPWAVLMERPTGRTIRIAAELVIKLPTARSAGQSAANQKIGWMVSQHGGNKARHESTGSLRRSQRVSQSKVEGKKEYRFPVHGIADRFTTGTAGEDASMAAHNGKMIAVESIP